MTDLCVQLDTAQFPDVRHVAYLRDHEADRITVEYPFYSAAEIDAIRDKLNAPA